VIDNETKTELQEMLKVAAEVSGDFTAEILGAIADVEEEVRPAMEEQGLSEEDQDANLSIIAVKALWDAYKGALDEFEEPARTYIRGIVEASEPAPLPEEGDEEEEDIIAEAVSQPDAAKARPLPHANGSKEKPATIAAPVLKAPKLKQ
jgi:division protein CdvB (Snf7/Vps24/ESCRT-III family)